MNLRISFVVILLFLGIGSTGAASPTESVNTVVGDVSWTKARSPRGESERIKAHLEWVETQLRQGTRTAVAGPRLARRLALLDALAAYRAATDFPKHTQTWGGRRPRWVDHRGVHCAVAYLVKASGREDLVRRIQDQHEYDYVSDMKTVELAEWAKHHGFTLTELAMIQPTYRDGGSVRVPSEIEQREAARRAREEAKRPRPLEKKVLEASLLWFVNRDFKRRCFGKRRGTWVFESDLAVKRGRRIRASVKVRDDRGRLDKGLSRCWSAALRRVARNRVFAVNHTVKKTVRARRTVTVEVPTHRQAAEASLLREDYASHHQKTSAEAYAACTKDWKAADFPLRLPIIIGSWRGGSRIDWPALKKLRGNVSKEERSRWQCINGIVNYGDIAAPPLYDVHAIVDLGPTGTMRVIQSKPIPPETQGRR